MESQPLHLEALFQIINTLELTTTPWYNLMTLNTHHLHDLLHAPHVVHHLQLADEIVEIKRRVHDFLLDFFSLRMS